MSKEFEISKLLALSGENKYATAVAAFEVIDLLEQIDIPKKVANRKPAVKAMTALSEEVVKWDYIDDEQRAALAAEMENSKRAQLDAVFGDAREAAAGETFGEETFARPEAAPEGFQEDSSGEEESDDDDSGDDDDYDSDSDDNDSDDDSDMDDYDSDFGDSSPDDE